MVYVSAFWWIYVTVVPINQSQHTSTKPTYALN